jgi:hypothetical protein
MHDPASPQPSPSNPEVAAIEMLAETIRELVTLAETLPVAAGDAERAAEVLERNGEDLAEVASLIRQARARSERFLP